MAEFFNGEYQPYLIALVYLVFIGMFFGARWLDKQAGNPEGALIVIKTVSRTTIKNGWSRD